MSKKKILIHSIVFSPDGVSTAYLYNDIALKFAEYGYEVVVLTTTPHYNIVPEEVTKQGLRRKLGGLYYESDFHGIRVIHVYQKKFKSALLRIVGFLYWHFFSLILGLVQKNVDVILSPSPPLTIGFINIVIAKLKGAKVIYNVQEIYPDFLINQKGLNSKPIIGALKYLERFVYNNSDGVTTIDPIFYNTILPRINDRRKLHIIPNFVDTDVFKPIETSQLKLDERLFPTNNGVFKVMYAGNMGHAQDWDTLVAIAEKVRDQPIEFFVIGEGVKKEWLVNYVQQNKLDNIHIIDYQPREKMAQLIAYADLHFIFMTKEMEDQGFPSKVYTIMACKKPLLIVSGKNTPITNFLTDINCAFITTSVVANEKCNELVAFLEKAATDRQLLTQMGERGYKVIIDGYSKQAVTVKYVDLITEIIDHGKNA